jgi:energy-converting hydrogenase Eha subunit A/Ni,Fe-hydrogenase III small subunit
MLPGVRTSHRLVHAGAVVVVALASLLAGAVVALSLNASKSIPWETPHRHVALCAAIVSGAVLCLALLAIMRNVSWRWIALASLAPMGVFLFLAHDDPPYALPDLGPRAESDDPGYRCLMWFGRGSSTSRLDELYGLGSDADDEVRLPPDPATWADYVREHQAEIVRAWEGLSLGLEWADHLAQEPPQGVWRHRVDDPALDLKAIRRLVFVVNAHAFMLAAGGETNQGLETLLPVIRAMLNLQRTGPLLTTGLVAAASLQATLLDAQVILLTGPVTPEMRGRLREALEGAPAVPDVLHTIFGGEIEYAASVLDQYESESASPLGPDSTIEPWIGTGLSLAGRLVFNPHHTLRVVAATLRAEEALAVNREYDRLDRWQPPAASWWEQVKNPVGRILTTMIVSAPRKEVQRIWDVEDLRVAVLKQLAEG